MIAIEKQVGHLQTFHFKSDYFKNKLYNGLLHATKWVQKNVGIEKMTICF